MKRYLKRCLTIITILLVIIFATSCGNGAKISTGLILENNFIGRRVMDVSISKSDFNRYMQGPNHILENFINEKCPPELTWELHETEADYVARFTLEFDTKETYIRKVTNLLGTSPVVDMVQADSFLAKGIAYSENFTSKDLLSWLSNALVEEGYIDPSYKDEIFENDTTILYFGADEYPTSETINVSEITYLPFNSIDILTIPYVDGTYDRKVIFNIPKSTMEEKRNEIKAFMEDSIPSGALSLWDTNTKSGDIVFSISLENTDKENIDAAMEKIFHSQAADFIDKKANNEGNMLEFNQTMTETLDLTKYISSRDGTASLRYFVASDVLSKAAILQDDGNTKDLSLWLDEDAYDGYIMAYSGDVSTITLNMEITYSYFPKEINIETVVKGNNYIQRTIEMLYDKQFEEKELTALKESINSIADRYALVDYKKTSSNYIIKFKQKGTKDEVSTGFGKIFADGNSAIEYDKDKKRFALHTITDFQEEISFGNFFGSASKNILVNYSVKLPAGDKISNDTIKNYADDDTVKIGEEEFKLSSYDKYILCKIKAESFNWVAILWWMLIILIVAVCLTAGYMGYVLLKEKLGDTDILANNKTNKANKIEKNIDIGNTIRFCTKCGEPIKKDNNFCTQCGNKIR